MTPFGLLLSLSGLSYQEAGDYLAVSFDTVRSWSKGRRGAPPWAIEQMVGLIASQETAATESIKEIATHPEIESVDLYAPADADAARKLGFPTVSAWAAMAGRVVARSPVPVKIV